MTCLMVCEIMCKSCLKCIFRYFYSYMSIAGMREDHFVKGFSFEYVYCMFAMLHMFD